MQAFTRAVQRRNIDELVQIGEYQRSEVGVVHDGIEPRIKRERSLHYYVFRTRTSFLTHCGVFPRLFMVYNLQVLK